MFDGFNDNEKSIKGKERSSVTSESRERVLDEQFGQIFEDITGKKYIYLRNYYFEIISLEFFLNLLQSHLEVEEVALTRSRDRSRS